MSATEPLSFSLNPPKATGTSRGHRRSKVRIMSEYVRPPIDPPVFRDAQVYVINYGDRWGRAGPPGESYSVTSNLERFAPLHTVAEALVDYLVSTFDVTRCEGIELAGAIEHPRDDVVRAVRLAPADARAASLTFVFTSFPSVVVLAGAVQEFRFPDCGCDACDESWNTQAEEMEWQGLAVAAGNFSESIKIGRKPWVDSSRPFLTAGFRGREHTTHRADEGSRATMST